MNRASIPINERIELYCSLIRKFVKEQKDIERHNFFISYKQLVLVCGGADSNPSNAMIRSLQKVAYEDRFTVKLLKNVSEEDRQKYFITGSLSHAIVFILDRPGDDAIENLTIDEVFLILKKKIEEDVIRKKKQEIDDYLQQRGPLVVREYFKNLRS